MSNDKKNGATKGTKMDKMSEKGHSGHPFDIGRYRVFIKYCVFSLKFGDFSELWQFCCSAGFLPAWCVYTH